MPVNDELGKRMKEFYETVPKTKLVRRMPVAIRIDGKAFHTFTRGFQKPFDEVLIKSMQETMKYLCENIQGCVLGYHQSDEITLILIDYKKLTSSAWFDYEVQKMCSISASMATMAFNKYFYDNMEIFLDDICRERRINPDKFSLDELNNNMKLFDAYDEAWDIKGMFDSRCFNIPKEEVANLIYWRQLDATRNSIQMVGRANFSHEELKNKTNNNIQDMLMTQKGINWNNFPTYQKRGSCCIKEKYFVEDKNGKEIKYPEGCSDPFTDEEIKTGNWRTHWVIDKEIPIFKGEGRKYIEDLIYVGE